MQSLGIILAVIGILPIILALSDRFEDWRRYRFPISSGIIGIAIGIALSSFLKAELIFERQDLFLAVSIALISCLVYLLFKSVTNEPIGDVARVFSGFCLFVIIVASIVYVNSIGEFDYSDRELLHTVELNIEFQNYDRAIDIIQSLRSRHSSEKPYLEAIDRRIDELKARLIDMSAG